MECPICGKPAQIVSSPTFDGCVLKCPDHAVFGISGTASVTLRAASHEYWQTHWDRARAEVLPGKFPIIMDPSAPAPVEYIDNPSVIS